MVCENVTDAYQAEELPQTAYRVLYSVFYSDPKYNHLVSNLVIFHNCHTITQALKELQTDGMKLTPELLAGLSPYRTHHLNRFGLYEMKERHPLPVDYGVGFET